MLKNDLNSILKSSLESLKNEGVIFGFDFEKIGFESVKDMRFGDFASNAAFVIAKKENKNPNAIAEAIAEKLNVGHRMSHIIERIEAVGGFVNVFVSEKYLISEVEKIVREREQYGRGSEASFLDKLLGKNKKAVVEYSSPNIAKSFGIGHLRSTIIGQAIYNIYKFLGWDVVGVNHLGDWGTPHGKIIYQIKRKNLDVSQLSINDLEKLYVDFYKEAEENPEMDERAREWFAKLEKGDAEARSIWQESKKISLKEFERIYNLLGVKIDKVIGESFYEDKTPAIIKEFKAKGLAQESEGALVVEFEGFEGVKPLQTLQTILPPAMLLKSDGATTYFARDLAALKYRLKKFSPKLMVYETGIEQTLHFEQLFSAARLAGWARGEKLEHIAHGFYRREYGKFKTRSGDTIHLNEVLEEAISRADNIIKESAPPRSAPSDDLGETTRGLSKKEIGAVARAIGIGGVKYNDLSHNPKSDIVFSWDKILNLKGNSAPYIQYTYARCKSILNKAPELYRVQLAAGAVPGTAPVSFSGEELGILRLIYGFPEVVRESAEKFSPNIICDFVFDLSQAFNLFYENIPVLSAKSEDEKRFRLLLTESVSVVIKNCLDLLGIESPEKL